MKELTKAIYAKCASGTDLYSDIGGRIYKEFAPDGADFPYMVYSVVSNVPEYPGGKTIEDVMIQFSLYSSNPSSGEIEDMLTHLRSIYDDCTLTITGETLIYFIRGNLTVMRDEVNTPRGSIGVWHYAQEYELMVVRS